MASSLQVAPIDDGLLQCIYDNDQALYPAPLPFERLRSWRDACPELSILCQIAGPDQSIDVGAIIVMPLLQSHWQDLLVGRQKETDVEASMLASAQAEGVEVGLHIFHVERFEGNGAVRGLAKLSMGLVQEIIKTKPWKILGYSALTASDSGRAVFDRLGYRPTGYDEIFVRNAKGELDLRCFGPQDTEEVATNEVVESRSRMVVKYISD